MGEDNTCIQSALRSQKCGILGSWVLKCNSPEGFWNCHTLTHFELHKFFQFLEHSLEYVRLIASMSLNRNWMGEIEKKTEKQKYTRGRGTGEAGEASEADYSNFLKFPALVRSFTWAASPEIILFRGPWIYYYSSKLLLYFYMIRPLIILKFERYWWYIDRTR